MVADGVVMANETHSPTGEETVHSPASHVERQAADALLLLDYAIAIGAKTADGLPIPQDLIRRIEEMAVKLGLRDGSGDAGAARGIAADEWAAFDLAYYDLAAALAPVTAETLRNTQVKPPGMRSWRDIVCGESTAIRFTRRLWAFSIGFMGFIIFSTWYQNVLALAADDRHAYWRILLELLTPWSYGGLGACVYLLRSAHNYIHERTFDVRRKPEYYNRILLGVMAGGAILLFVDHLTNDQGEIVELSSAALGFLAGYNTDFLFKAIERITAAILPKTGIETVKTAPAKTAPVDINALTERMEKASGADKEFYKALLARVTGVHAG
jgi:hypothetical protein